MNRDDLLALVTVETSGLLTKESAAGRDHLAWEIQQQLLKIARIHTVVELRRMLTSTDRRNLFEGINAAADSLILNAINALKSIEDANCDLVIDIEKLSGGAKKYIRYRPSDAAHDVIKTLGFIDKIRALEPKQQASLVIALIASFEMGAHDVMLTLAMEVADLAHPLSRRLDAQTHSSALEESRKIFQANKKRLASKAAQLLTQLLDEKGGLWTMEMPVRIPPRIKDNDLETISAWYRQLASSMSMSIPLDPKSPLAPKKQSEAAWTVYNDCGRGFAVIAVWLRALSYREEGKRCRLCYRHLGNNMKHFCVEHTRKSNQRQPARELHVAKAYKKEWKAFFREMPSLKKLFSGEALQRLTPPEHFVTEARLMLTPNGDKSAAALVQPAVELATLLQPLYPLVSPVIQDMLSEHFVAMLQVARKPFQAEPSLHSRSEIHRLQGLAPKWLSWSSYFRTLLGTFGRIEKDDLTHMPGAPWKGLDIDHPITQYHAVLPRSIALDLAHLRVWTQEDRRFEDYAYFDVEKARLLRNTRRKGNGRKRSYASVGRELGVSDEAVRKALIKKARAQPLGRQPPKKRILARVLEEIGS